MNPADWVAADEIDLRLVRYDLLPGATYAGAGALTTEVFFVESGPVERAMRGPGAELIDRCTAGTTGELLAADDVEHTLTAVSDGRASVLVFSVVPRLPDQ
jgi:hypothetical protein